MLNLTPELFKFDIASLFESISQSKPDNANVLKEGGDFLSYLQQMMQAQNNTQTTVPELTPSTQPTIDLMKSLDSKLQTLVSQLNNSELNLNSIHNGDTSTQSLTQSLTQLSQSIQTSLTDLLQNDTQINASSKILNDKLLALQKLLSEQESALPLESVDVDVDLAPDISSLTNDLIKSIQAINPEMVSVGADKEFGEDQGTITNTQQPALVISEPQVIDNSRFDFSKEQQKPIEIQNVETIKLQTNMVERKNIREVNNYGENNSETSFLMTESTSQPQSIGQNHRVEPVHSTQTTLTIPDWQQQIIEHSQILAAQNSGSAHLSLEVPGMGDMLVHIQAIGREVSLKIETDNNIGTDFFKQHAVDLKQIMNDAGLRLGQMVVQASSTQTGLSSGQHFSESDLHESGRDSDKISRNGVLMSSAKYKDVFHSAVFAIDA